MTTLPTFPDLRTRHFWVQAALRQKCMSFSSIARENGWSRIAVSNAMRMPSDPQERAIAEALGVSQIALFPERYDAAGNRLHKVRNNNAAGHRRNVKNGEAA